MRTKYMKTKFKPIPLKEYERFYKLYGRYYKNDTTLCVKGDQIVKTYSNIISVEVDKEYQYFILTQQIYQHKIIFKVLFNDCDKIIYTDSKGIRKELTQND